MADKTSEENVVTLAEARGKKQVKDLLKDAKLIEPNLDFRGKTLHFSTSVYGGGDDPDNNHLRIIVHDVTEGYANAIAGLSFTRRQWEEFTAAGEAILAAHLKGLSEENDFQS